MAQLLLVSSRLPENPNREVGDIVGVYRDTHKFSTLEKAQFNIQQVKGSVADVQAKLQSQIKEEIGIAFKSKKTGKWSFTEPKGDDLEGEERVWKSPVNQKWYFYQKKQKHSFTVADLSAVERTTIETVLPNELSTVKDEVYEKMLKQDLSSFFENGVEATDLNATSVIDNG